MSMSELAREILESYCAQTELGIAALEKKHIKEEPAE